MWLNSFSNQVSEALVKLEQNSSETHQKRASNWTTQRQCRLVCTWLSVRSTVTPFTDGLKKPTRVCDCLPGLRMNVPNYMTSPTETELQVHVGACARAATENCICAGANMSLSHLSSLWLALFTRLCLHLSSLAAVFLPKPEQLCVFATHRNNSAIFFPLYFYFAGAIIWMTHSFPIT